MPGQFAKSFAGLGIPEDNKFIVAACREDGAVGREFGIVERIPMSFELPDELPVGDVPQRGDASETFHAGGRQQSIVADEVDRVHRAGVRADCVRRHVAPNALRLKRHFVVPGDGEPLSIRRVVDGSNGPGVGVRLDVGDDEHEPVGSSTFRAFGAAVDPAANESDLIVGRLRFVLGRHRRVAVSQHLVENTPLRISRQDGRFVVGSLVQRGERFQREVPLAVGIVMAAGTVFFEEGSDVLRIVGVSSLVGRDGKSHGTDCRQDRKQPQGITKHVASPESNGRQSSHHAE